MTLTIENKAAELFEKIIKMVGKNFPEPESQQIENFVQYFYQYVAPEDMLERGSVSNLYGAAVSYWRFARQYTSSQTKVRVYNPQFEQDGWQSPHTIVSILIKDMPFLAESVRMAVNQFGLTVHLIIPAVLETQRNAQGQLLKLWPYDNGGKQLPPEGQKVGNYECLIHLEVDRQTETGALEKIKHGLEKVLANVRIVVDDWQKMQEKMGKVIQEFEAEPPPLDVNEIKEVREFLQWAQASHFTFLGYQEYELSHKNDEVMLHQIPGTGLGILRDEEISHTSLFSKRQFDISQSFAKLPVHLRQLAEQPSLLLLNKTTAHSIIHRPVRMDYIGIKRINSDGIVTGERRFLGLYTSTAYHQRTVNVPIIRCKVKYVFEKSGFRRDYHKNQVLFYILESYPRDELFQMDQETLLQTVMGILLLQERHQIRLFVWPDIYGRFLSCLVYVPRERYDTNIRKKMQGILLKAFGGTHIEFNARLSESALAQVHFIVYTPTGTCHERDLKKIEHQLIEVTRTWADVLREALLEHNGEERGSRLFSRYEDAFSVAYREDFSPHYTIYDIDKIEKLSKEGGLAMSLYRPIEAEDNSLRFKLFHPQSHLELSKVLPMLENMGVTVLSERAYEVQTPHNPSVWIQDFEMRHNEVLLDIGQLKAIFQETFAQVWQGNIENDGFNRLVLRTQLNWREIIIFRAYWKYLRQAGGNFSQEYVEHALENNPVIIRLLLNLFYAQSNPTQINTLGERESLVQDIENALDSVVSLDEDRILRRFLGVILATLRTNYFQRDEHGQPKPYLSFKVDPHKIPDLPEPRPMFEIFVYSPRVEGVHLRGGKVARGGLRWSDRFEDFRTEVLGLMKAQMVKNAVIVPVGSKGGFVAKRLPVEKGREAIQKEGIECYKTFIRGLLDLTDNYREGKIVPPIDVIKHDEDDPYLVVAADKGTATFSDIANGIAKEYHFWLDDAFASGGSAGYDHKKMGITARGAWESVKRHFRELGLNTQTQNFTAIGIGDMSGDVFGNGMLLSKHIQLIGAFNHLHIFLDPNPDPEKSWEERQRLFNLPRSTWADYNDSLISKGGGVFSRNLKSIRLSPQVQARLGTKAKTLTPNKLIQAMLCAQVDLLWNGGIGTYVKSQTEHHIDVGDRTNDALRVNGQDLRCKVVGEGGNLGFTQLGRIGYALNEGRINTDAIDNSGGVDCSDHEVNIKILLNAIVANGDMTHKQRNHLLAEMTDTVANLVLKNNYLQTQGVSMSMSISSQMIDLHSRFIHHLENKGQLDRELEFLPNDKTLAERRAKQQGLTESELCVLQAYSKITLYNALLESDLSKEAYFTTILEKYFPPPLSERFTKQIAQHSLCREIIATELTNMVVNRGGISLVYRLTEDTGQTSPDIVRAFMVAWEVFEMKSLWADIEYLDNQIEAKVQLSMMRKARQQIERVSRWLLTRHQMPLDINKTINALRPGIIQLAHSLLTLIDQTERETLETTTQNLVKAGVPFTLASRVASLVFLLSALDIVEVANATGVTLEKVATVHFLLGTRLKLHWLRDHISELPRDNRWAALSRSSLREDLYRTHRQLTTKVLQADTKTLEPKAKIEAWMEKNHLHTARCQKILSDISHAEKPDLSMLSVAVKEIQHLL
ncbi:NAD-glutamate dehydrogenase [Candidatus Parabeggiatoa sp. HSG14]|uniref:NAD-glutamate dehydrogenase n=1 Tax=Candidatus Parabeggiatoa sp. HSG14 TaxID=3055593 RepID=UPI0025A8992F|nr:NAD-glutamate dehydrogenase [Thiotrichales bacterium HSG14]